MTGRHLFTLILALLGTSAAADTNIAAGTTVTVSDPAAYFGGAGNITLQNGATLDINPGSNGTYTITNGLVLSGAAGTTNLKCNRNDTIYNFTGPITSNASAAQTLGLFTGSAGQGDREEVTFDTAIPNATGGSAVSVAVTFRTQSSGSFSYLSLKGANTFTGDLSLSQTGAAHNSYLTVGGRGYKLNNSTPGFTPATGGLAANYPGSVTLAASTNFVYASSAAQNMAGVISGAGAMRTVGTGALTLSNVNTYTGNTTVDSGASLVLANSGGLKFVLTNTSANKITGAGSATLNGSFTVDTSAVTNASGAWTLVDTTTKTFGASFGLTGFSGPVGNLYTKASGSQYWTFNKSTGVLSLGSSCAILSCDFGGLGQAIINEAAGTAMLTVPIGQAVTALAPTFTLSPNATISPASGSTRNFTNPVVYRVTAQDGITYKDYTVTVQSYASWAYSGSFYIVTTPDGANLPGGASVTDFPLLVRLNSNNFDFSQAQPDGSDLRFTQPNGNSLFYQIEQWDPVGGKAAIWVRIPSITGNTTQEIKVYWGKSGVASQSNGANVFNSSNGYASVIHLDDSLADTVGTTTPSNVGSTAVNGLIGRGRAFATGQGILCGTSITGLPSGAGPFSTGVWIRANPASSDILGWGVNQPSQKKVVMQLVSPPHISMDCWFGGANVTGSATISDWTYIVHTFQTTGTRLYVNGVLDASTSGGSMAIPTPSTFYLGGWSGTYNYSGEMDEVRISNVVRSADWVKLEYENQKPLQTLVGSLVSAGSNFSVSPNSLTVNETATGTLSAQAGGALKVYWMLRKNGQDTLLATDQLTLNYTAPRVDANDSAVIQFKALFPGGVQTIDVPLSVMNTVPNPAFTLVPSTTSWDGRSTMTVSANVSNLAAMQAAGFAALTYKWTVSGVAVIKQGAAGTLSLLRSQGSGPMTVTLTMDNGGSPVTKNITINVDEPASDPWVQRTPAAGEKPVNKQFFARDPGTGLGTVFYNGTQTGSPDTVYLKVYRTASGGSETLYATHRQALVGGAYGFSAPIAAGLFSYRVVYGTTTGGVDTDLTTVTDLVCGDAFIIEGQSNALATDNTAPNDTTTTNPWIRTYGLTSGWGYAISKGNDLQLGLWGWYLANRLVTNNSMPICIINGAVGGTRIDQHRPNPADHGNAGGTVYSIYANLYNRVVGAKLTHGIRGLFWHQGENNQGSAGPDGDYDYKFYQQYFVDISASWKQDFPNLRNYYLFQIWPAACGDQSRNDQLREVQRTLPWLYSNMKIMSTLGFSPGSSCHYEPAGYQVFSDRIGPIVEEDVYGRTPAGPITAPNLKRAYFTTAARNEIALVFDQDITWNPGATSMMFLENGSGVAAGSVTDSSDNGDTLTLQVSGAGAAATLTYVKGLVSWQQANLLTGANGIAALTFADVPIGPAAPTGLSAAASIGQVGLTWNAASGATGYLVKRSTTQGGPYSTIATTASPGYTDLSVSPGTTYYYVVSAISKVGTSTGEGLPSNQASAMPPTAYNIWSLNPSRGLTAGMNDDPLMDPDFDGLENLLEFVLGSHPMAASVAALPTLDKQANDWVFEYYRNDDSLPPATTQIVQYSSNLSNWTDITIPATTSGVVTITAGSPSDHVRVTIPSIGDKLSVRLKVTQ